MRPHVPSVQAWGLNICPTATPSLTSCRGLQVSCTGLEAAVELWPQDTLAESSRAWLAVPDDVTVLDTTQGQDSKPAQTTVHNKGLSQGLKDMHSRHREGLTMTLFVNKQPPHLDQDKIHDQEGWRAACWLTLRAWREPGASPGCSQETLGQKETPDWPKATEISGESQRWPWKVLAMCRVSNRALGLRLGHSKQGGSTRADRVGIHRRPGDSSWAGRRRWAHSRWGGTQDGR